MIVKLVLQMLEMVLKLGGCVLILNSVLIYCFS